MPELVQSPVSTVAEVLRPVALNIIARTLTQTSADLLAPEHPVQVTFQSSQPGLVLKVAGKLAMGDCLFAGSALQVAASQLAGHDLTVALSAAADRLIRASVPVGTDAKHEDFHVTVTFSTSPSRL